MLVADGDSKGPQYVRDTYGKDTVMHELCGNHTGKLAVGKLFELRDQTYTEKPGGGRSWTFSAKVGNVGFHSEKIRPIGSYFQAIIKDRSLSVQDKQRHIMGLFKHNCDWPLNPNSAELHDDCYVFPSGECCPWQRAARLGNPRAFGNDGKFREYTLRTDPEKVKALALIRGVFEKLSAVDTLARCSLGLTTNGCESLHSKQWAMGSKAKHLSYARLLFLCQRNILQHVLGYEKGDFISRNNYGTTEAYLEVLRKEDKNRLRVASRPPGSQRSSRAGKLRARKAFGAPKPAEVEYRPGHFGGI